jgi:hypothetical protein
VIGATALLLCLAGPSSASYEKLSAPSVAFAAGYPADAQAQVLAALPRSDLKFLGGYALNSFTSLRYGSDTPALNRFLGDLAKCPDVRIEVRFAKIEDGCDWRVSHLAQTNRFQVEVNLDSGRLQMQDLELPAIEGRSAKPKERGDQTQERKSLLIIGASSVISPFGQPQLLGALLESKGMSMNVEGKFYGTEALDRMLSSRLVWDYVIMDAWQFRRGGTDAPGFPDAVAAFVKQVRAHSPHCKIILFPWWIPRGPDATNEGVIKVFQRCVETAKQNDIWVATTGPAFMEARLARPDLQVTVSNEDGHPGTHGAYLNACSLFAILTGQSPVGLPATLKIPGRDKDLTIAPDDAKFLQDLAWKVYQRELKYTKPAK